MSIVIRKYPDLTTPTPAYGGKVSHCFSPKTWTHFLVVDSILEKLAGVTGVLKKAVDKSQPLMRWAVKLALSRAREAFLDHLGPDGCIQIFEAELDKILAEAKRADTDALDEAGGTGHQAHDFIDRASKAIIAKDTKRLEEILANFPEDERAENGAIAALDFLVSHNVRIVKSEFRALSLKHKCCGTGDMLALVDSCDNRECCDCGPFTDRLSYLDWKCLLPNQTLLRADGSTIRADQAMPGDSLIAFNKQENTFVIDSVKSVKPGGTQPCVEVKTKQGRRLKVSANHPVLVDSVWKEAGLLAIGDPVILYRQPPSTIDSITTEEARLLGYLIGDGGFSDPTSRTFTNTNPHVLKDFLSLCKSFGFTTLPSGRWGEKKGHYNIGGIGSFLRQHDIYCCPSKEKHIPNAVMSGSREVMLAFLSAYFDCDGYISKLSIQRPDVCFTTVSERLAADVQDLLFRLGVVANVWRQDNKMYKKKRHDSPPYWIKVNCKTESKKLLAMLTLRIAEKESRRIQWLNALKNVVDKPYPPDYVAAVVPLPEQATIGIEMEKFETFVTSSIVTHNTSNHLYTTYLWQSAFYSSASMEEFPELKIEDRWILRLDKDDASFEPWHAAGDEAQAEDLHGFLCCLATVRALDKTQARIDAIVDVKKAMRAEQKALAKLARDRIECPKAKDYQGIRRTKCLPDGSQCEACRRIWEEKHGEHAPEQD